MATLVLSSCTAAPIPHVTTPTIEIQLTVATPHSNEIPAEATPQAIATPNNTHGVAVTLIHACSDGTRTILRIRTDLDSKYWGLRASDFSPLGKVYFETSTIFLQNGQLFSSTSSGKRDGPVFNLFEQLAQAEQTFIYPTTPSPNSQFELKAEVTLANLPPSYKPPATGIAFVEPGIIAIPTQFTLPVTIDVCR